MTDTAAIGGTQMATCRWCGLIHGPRCGMVKAIEYADDGVTVRRVEFFAPKDYPPLQSSWNIRDMMIGSAPET